jgi:dTDP-4-amino-4,6-dideoxygalactose transaminase
MIPISKPYIGEKEKRAVLDVLDSGYIVQGPRTAELERRFADLCGVRHAIATSSGTTALHLALMAHGIGPGDEVITTPFTFIASVNSILFTAATPVFADIEESTFNIDPQQVRRAITPRTKAIMPVHLYGQLADMDELQALAREHNLILIEDACQAVGATYKGQRAGSFGTGVFSLYATKNVMAGEGGMITTNDDEVAARCRLLRNHGMERRYYHETVGYNFRLTDLNAALGLAQLERLEQFTERRRTNAAYFNERLHSVTTPTEAPNREHVWHQYTIRIDSGRDRDQCAARLQQAGVGTGIFYPIPAHKHQYMRDIVGDVTMPIAEKLAGEVLSLPVHPQLNEEDLNTIVCEVNKL